MASKDKKQEKPNMWEQLLNEAMQTSKPPTGTVIILGNKGSGKRTLINNLIKQYNQKIYEDEDNEIDTASNLQGSASSIDYAYLDVRNLDDRENNEIIARLNVWMIDEPEQKDMLQIAFKDNVFKNCVIVICVDLTEPWKIKQTLNEWVSTLSEKLSEVYTKVPLALQDEIREKLKIYIRNYSDPKFDEDGKLKTPFKKSYNEDDENIEKLKKEIPLPEGVLTVNYGIPIIFCVTKSEYADTLEREKDGEKKLDLIQMAVREKALTYSASVIYTSSKMNIDLDVFYEYIVHRLYGFSNRFKAEVIQKDAIFIPSGYDRPTILSETFKDLQGQNYEDLIAEPVNKRTIIREEINSEENQAFYAKLSEMKRSGPPQAILTPASSRGQAGFQFPSGATPRNQNLLNPMNTSSSTLQLPTNLPPSIIPQNQNNNITNIINNTSINNNNSTATNNNNNVNVVKNFYANLMQNQNQRPQAPSTDNRASGQVIDKEKLLKLISQKKPGNINTENLDKN